MCGVTEVGVSRWGLISLGIKSWRSYLRKNEDVPSYVIRGLVSLFNEQEQVSPKKRRVSPPVGLSIAEVYSTNRSAPSYRIKYW
ncbi:hypothetical protein HanRHA438_Chr09g0405541 [Helianthus annuus]|nr:hypothetical protein HanRHA438_Chr09g0405541 [Helianthus annuus]